MAFTANLLGTPGNDTLTFDNPNQIALDAQGFGGDDLFELGIDSNGSQILGGPDGDYIIINQPISLAPDLADIVDSTIRGGLGDDSLYLSDEHKSILNTFINANEGNDYLYMDEPDNIVNSTYRGGQGNDTVLIQDTDIDVIQGTLVNGNSETDYVYVDADSINASSIYGGIGNDSVIVDGLQLDGSLVSGDLGDDYIVTDIATFASTVRGGDGNDSIFHNDTLNNASSVIGNLGNDYVYVSENLSDSSTRGGQGNDFVIVDTNEALVNGNQDNDYIYVGDNTDGEVYGGVGDDSVIIGAGDGDIIGNEGADTLIGGGGADTFIYTFGDTQLTGVAGFDSIEGFASGTDEIDLTNTDLVFDITGLTGGITINADAVITGGINNLQQFVQAGAGLTTAGATIGISPTSNPAFASGSFIFVSDGDGVRSSGDLLIAFDVDVTAITFSGGDITAIV